VSISLLQYRLVIKLLAIYCNPQVDSIVDVINTESLLENSAHPTSELHYQEYVVATGDQLSSKAII